MMVLASRTAVLSPPVFFVWKALMRPDVRPKNQGFAWPVMLDCFYLLRNCRESAWWAASI
jgi:hypothetical protein